MGLFRLQGGIIIDNVVQKFLPKFRTRCIRRLKVVLFKKKSNLPKLSLDQKAPLWRGEGLGSKIMMGNRTNDLIFPPFKILL